MDTTILTIQKARTLLDTKEVSARELAEAYLATIATRDPEIHAFLEVYDDVRAQAEEADARIARGERAPLLGIPLAIKDNILVHGRVASSASKMLENYRATYDAHVVESLKKQGVVFLGRTNMDEFAMGSSTEKSAFGPTKNPRDTKRVPGGSSGGSAASVAGDLALCALGSDTGGSIRQPASFCGVVGLKPTYGAVSRRGLMAMGSSLDCIGPLTKTVADAETIFDVLHAHDERDATSLPFSRERMASFPEKKKYVVGVPRSLTDKCSDERVQNAFEATLTHLQSLGHEVVTVDLPLLSFALPTYYVTMCAEVSSNLARFDGVRYGLHVETGDRIQNYKKSRAVGFGPEPRRRILLGTYVLSAGYYDAYYGKAMQVRERMRAEVAEVFKKVDVLATPTAPSPAFLFGEKNADPVTMYLEDIFTVSANMLGVPAISVPSGFVERDGSVLPIGFHMMAPHHGEKNLFALGKDIEKGNKTL
jgi:aspartyl-tRNA(Asn)/glutamyl-tRNA(Gln) amidotransferase subunit A